MRSEAPQGLAGITILSADRPHKGLFLSSVSRTPLDSKGQYQAARKKMGAPRTSAVGLSLGIDTNPVMPQDSGIAHLTGPGK